jgi:hypothetical protein
MNKPLSIGDHLLVIMLISISLLGCSEQRADYLVLIGETSRPPYNELAEGNTYPSLLVSGVGDVGEILISAEGREINRYGKGALAFRRGGGALEFNGRMDRECYLYVVRGGPTSPVTLLVKRVLPTNQTISLTIDLDSLRDK